MSFGKPLGEFGQIQRFIGEAYANLSAGRALLYATAASMDLGVCVCVCARARACVRACMRV
jgi:alkylation response protein AidB-like acyl-CoA dehydrogenase